ncbi:S-methyl-5-thioribose-1-phosphate isomerase [Sphingobium chlorophenolicum]|uniref:Methylthioribose-1-phosphate isomerase n=1 Tax=Sphingobium chlorophenolicum TaxID=46429 RepID=A0A081R8A3_SPHCR|nr:S-methyl-5-thioribose-1-phosphate isomerase [Sphingobium chlorophenolicum]KEQ51426.1 Methylthioribose-1-phosphate isomerase [Sphingobium chlorophenolicum]
MNIDGTATRSIWVEADGRSVGIFDQRLLPWALERMVLRSVEDAAVAIADMATRGAPLIGAVAAYGLAFGLYEDASDTALDAARARLLRTRPTAVNLRWALDRIGDAVRPLAPSDRAAAAFAEAGRICDEDVAMNRAIGAAGLPLIRALAERKGGKPVNILTHCNAGWLATVDWGTATAPLYMAHDAGIPLHIWVDETRPRNQGALTAFELAQHGVPHSYIVDNAGGLLMQQGLVDMVIVGTDRVTANGDVCNKIGTYLKALAAKAHGVPFYVALPSSTYDPATPDGASVPIEQRSPDEVRFVSGTDEAERLVVIRLTGSPAYNPAFDITPAALVTGYVTDHGLLTDAADLRRSMAM